MPFFNEDGVKPLLELTQIQELTIGGEDAGVEWMLNEEGQPKMIRGWRLNAQGGRVEERLSEGNSSTSERKLIMNIASRFQP